MPTLLKHQQIGPKACSASCIMCAAHELGTDKATFGNDEAEKLYENIWRGKDDEALFSKVIVQCNTLHLKTTLIENQALIASLCQANSEMKKQYDAYRQDVKATTPRTNSTPFAIGDFDNEARLILVVLIEGESLTHSVLARKDDKGAIYVMNPDGATDTKEDGLLAWMNASTPTARKIGNVDYYFTGIGLRLTT